MRTRALRRITRETVASQVRSPSFAWSQRVRHVNYGECYYFQPISVDDVDSLDAQLACEHFNQVPYTFKSLIPYSLNFLLSAFFWVQPTPV